jgi:hypothetical protein
MTDTELDSLTQMIKFFLSKTKEYWDTHPEELYSICTELKIISGNAR